jgi:twinkle protein
VIHEKHTVWLESRGISAELAAKFGLETVSKDGANWLAVPYVERGQTINHKYRLTSEKRHQMDQGAPLTLWNHDCLLEDTDTPVVICEGEWDAMTALSLGWRAVSVPNGAPHHETEDVENAKRYEYLWRSRDALNRVKQFILATDDDTAGHALRSDLVALLGADRCAFVEYPFPSKDLNEVLCDYGKDAVSAALVNAKPVPVKGLFKLRDFPEQGHVETIPIGIPGLSELVNIVPGTLTVLTGFAGQGKTSLTMAIVAQLLKNHIPVTIASFETRIRPIMERRLIAAIAGYGEHVMIPDEERERAEKLIDDYLTIIAQMVGEDEEMTLEGVLDLARLSKVRENTKVFIFDPWNEIEHKRRPDESETDYTGRALRAMRRFAFDNQVAVWIIAHPSKPALGVTVPGLYHISGSAHWANKPDYGLTYTRPDKTSNIAKVYVLKVKMGLPGKEGDVELAYDWRTSRYTLPELEGAML